MAIDQRLLGSAIRRVREFRGISQAKLAEEAGLRGNSVALIERGQRGVSMATLNDLADALKIPAACLTMLGTSKFSGLKGSAGLVKSMQKLILATVTAEETLSKKTATKKPAPRRVGKEGEKRARRLASTKR
jgi:transcriptional regulator with XRE-family HTH domain